MLKYIEFKFIIKFQILKKFLYKCVIIHPENENP